MKKIFPFQSSFVLMIFLLAMICMSSCGTSKGMSDQASKDPNLVKVPDNQSINETWSSLLSRVVGVDIQGVEPNISVRIRGDNSLELSNEPLYVLDGVRLGQDFSRLASAILPKDVESIHVLKGSAAARFGESSGNGVIVVRSKE